MAIGTSSISATLGLVSGSTVLTVTSATLVSIAVTPANPSIAAGTDRQFTATGTYSDATTADLTTSVSWASATTSVATIGATTGLAHAVSPGTSTISATQGAISGSTVLTVSPATVPSCNKTWASAGDGLWSDATKWTPSGEPTATDDVCITADGSYTVTLNGAGSAGSVTLGASGNIQQPTLRITDPGGPSTLTSAAGFSNHGRIVLETSAGYGDTLAITSGTLTNAADGSIDINYGVGGPATISGQVVNDGSVTVAAGATLSMSGHVVNDGAFTIASGATMSMSGSAPAFDQAGGTLADSSTIPVTGPTFSYHGGTITGAVVLSAATLDLEAPAASPDTFILEGSANVLASDVPAGHTLRITDPGGPSTLTSAAGFSNHGRIVLETSAGYGDTLAITSGTLTNAADGSIDINYGVGGPATISGQVVNDGSVTINSGATLLMAGGAPSFDQAGGTLTVDGSFPVTGATFIYHGGTIPSPFVLSGATLDLEAPAASPDTFILEGSANVLASDVPAGHTLRITDPGGPSTLTSAAGFSNHGRIVLETSAGYGDTLAITSGTLTNAADGSIDINYGVGGPATISGQVVNDGSVTVAAGATLSMSGHVVNDGAFTIASGATMSMSGSAPAFDQAGGTLADSSTIPVTGPTFSYHGGTITGAVVLSAATLDLEAPAASPDTFILEGSANVLASDVPAGHTLRITDPGGPSTLTSAAGFSNHGRIVLETSAGYGDTLAITSGTLTNAADGSIDINYGVGGPATISGQVVNDGSVTINSGATLLMAGGAPSFDQAGGTLTVDGSFPVTGATFIYHGGTIPSPFVLSGATLDLEAPAASPDTFILEGSANVLASDVPAGHTLRITDPGGPSTLTSAAGFSNHGRIVLETSAGYGDTLAITSGTLTNAADGSIDINYGVGGPATISGQVVNDGSVTVAAGATLNMAGRYTQTSIGELQLEIAGVASVGKLALTAGDSASLAGTLTIRFVDGFVPTVGQTFTIVTYGSETGIFTTQLPIGYSGSVDYGATAAILTVTGVAGPTLVSIAVSPANPTSVAGTDRQFTATGTYSDATTADLTTSVSWASATTSVATIGATTGLAHAVSPGTSTISATQGAISGSTVLTVSPVTKLNQTITFAAITAKTLAQSPLTVHPTASSSLAVTLSSTTPTVCTVSGTTINLLTVGTCTIKADQAGSATYNPAPTITRSFGVSKASQTITFANPGTKALAQSPLTVNPTASSSLAVTLSSTTPTVCTVSGTTINLLTVGTCTIKADQAGSATYNPAATVSRSFSVVTKLNQTITFAAITAKTLAQSPLTVHPTASSSLAVTLSSTTPTVCTVSGTTINLLTVGTCTIKADQAGSATYNPAPTITRSFGVSKASQTITFANPGTKALAQSPLTVNPTASSSLAVTLSSTTPTVCTVSGTTINLLTVGTCTIKADQAGSATYNPAATVSRSFSVVTKLNQTITFAAITAKTLAQSPLTVHPTASSSLAVTLSSTTPTVCTVSGTTINLLTVGTCTIKADQAGSATYNPAPTITRSFGVSKASQTITFANPGTKALAQSPLTVNPTASSSLAVTLSSTTPTVCTVSGTTINLLTVGTCTIKADQAGSATYNPAATVSRSFSVVTKLNQTITFAAITAKTLAQSPLTVHPTASSSLAVTLSSTTPTVCTVSGTTINLLTVGTCTIKADQAGSATYNPAPTITRSFGVS